MGPRRQLIRFGVAAPDFEDRRALAFVAAADRAKSRGPAYAAAPADLAAGARGWIGHADRRWILAALFGSGGQRHVL